MAGSWLGQARVLRCKLCRVIEKRLLVRFKDKNPAPLNHVQTIYTCNAHAGVRTCDQLAVVSQLDTLLRVTYQKLHEDAQSMVL